MDCIRNAELASSLLKKTKKISPKHLVLIEILFTRAGTLLIDAKSNRFVVFYRCHAGAGLLRDVGNGSGFTEGWVGFTLIDAYKATYQIDPPSNPKDHSKAVAKAITPSGKPKKAFRSACYGL